jgi:hypothetical protein
LFYKFRNNVAQSRLQKRAGQVMRREAGTNLADAKDIGLIFDATDPASISAIKKFVNELQGNNCRVFVIGFVDTKKIEDTNLIRSGFNLFSQHELTWFFKPVSPFIEDFLNRRFDILFNLDLNHKYPLCYISSLSKASFKVGKFYESCDHLDFMINVNEHNKVGFLIEQLVKYLNMIKVPEKSVIE